ncbi:uncharacterized protein M421DRAFT_98685 [Didymella exigua CBS 183.55]|uniref:Glycosyltransferase family 34 protein n=1 Tax=Didymella exigua CBS 183.55 TaxID=1150837 RepID=A0A6A5RW83_9PLEO|nr:uncharacterized protein M421DRAFT_98685 [Didymella exigua CBS 183.55]KAF1931560.1 hypothetical protein M421DRAFT_98685 [Didymella exigua CBS 183.55]
MLATQRYYSLALAVFLVTVSFSFFLFHRESVIYNELVRSPYRHDTTAAIEPTIIKPTIRDAIVTLFDSIRIDPADPGYRDSTGKYFAGGSKTTWTEPLKKKVLVLDIDTRVPIGSNEILNPGTLDWDSLDMSGGQLVSNAVMNHYLYAQIHGYDYKLYSAQSIPDHYNTWIMPHVFHELVPDYDFVVAMDADVTVSHLEVPLEWMFNRWGVTRKTSMALPWDTEEFHDNKSISTDSYDLRVLNTGFVVAQNLPLTMSILAAWKDCTTETRYPGCGKWKQRWSHEQRAFSEYIRHDPEFNVSAEAIVGISCDDAVGWPGFKEDVHRDYPITECNGNFFRHHTLEKSKTKESSAGSVMQALSRILQVAVQQNLREVWYQEPEQKEPEKEVGNVENVEDEEEGQDDEADTDMRSLLIEHVN